MNHRIEVLLSIFTLKPDVKCLLKKNSQEKYCLPNDWLEKEELLLDRANKFFTTVTGISSAWIKLKNIGIFDNVSTFDSIKIIGVVFGGTVDEQIPLKVEYYQWVDVKTLFSNLDIYPHHLDIIQQALRKLP